MEHIELHDSRQINDGPEPTAVLKFRLLGDNDETAALTYARTNLPATFLGLVRDDIKLDPAGFERWIATSNYSLHRADRAETFETSGQTQRILTSRQTVASYAATGAGTPPTFDRAIQCDGQTVHGTDITVPTFTFSYTRTLALATVTESFKLGLFAQTGTTNNNTWKGYAAGEVLFLGASGSQRGQEDYQITGRFAASPNVTGLAVGGISGINKAGWDYLWFYFDHTVSQNTLTKRPRFAYVERVYNSSNFAALPF